MLCGPTDSEAVLYVAFPELSDTVAKELVPSLKVTEPVGVPAPGDTAVTAAVNVTDCPKVDGFVEDVTLLRLSALFTVCPPESAPLLLVKLVPVLGVYVAETVWLPIV